MTLLRRGGIAKLPNGRVIKHEIVNDPPLVLGKQYLGFLKYHVSAAAFTYGKTWAVENGVMKAMLPDDVLREQAHTSEVSGKPVQGVLIALRKTINRN